MLGRQSLGAKAQLVVVQTADARYVLGVTEHGVSVVDRLPVEEPVHEPVVTPVVAPVEEELAEPAVSSAATFDSILAGTSRSSATAPAPEMRRRVRRRADPLRGSIISPETWRQTAEAIRRSR